MAGKASGWQLGDDAPTSCTRFGHKIMIPWTDDLIRTADCRDGDGSLMSLAARALWLTV